MTRSIQPPLNRYCATCNVCLDNFWQYSKCLSCLSLPLGDSSQVIDQMITANRDLHDAVLVLSQKLGSKNGIPDVDIKISTERGNVEIKCSADAVSTPEIKSLLKEVNTLIQEIRDVRNGPSGRTKKSS